MSFMVSAKARWQSAELLAEGTEETMRARSSVERVLSNIEKRFSRAAA
jgi:hypothetical protein